MNTQNLILLNQPSKKLCSCYIGPYTIIEKISSQAYYKLDIGLLKEYNFSLHGSELPNDIPSLNDFIYGDDTFHVHSIIDHKTVPHLSTYTKGPVLLFKIKWEGYDPFDDSWEP